MFILGIVLLGLGSLTGLYAGILLLVRAFKASLLWGLISFLIPGGSLIFIIANWSEGRRPLIAHLVALGLVATGIFTSPALMKAFAPGLQLALHGHPAATPAPAFDPIAEVNAQIAGNQQDGLRLKQQIDSQTNNLIPIYTNLATRRANLKAGDQKATAAFNQDAAAYTARKKQLDALRQQAQSNDEQLSALLEKRTQLTASAVAQARMVVIYGTSWCPACKMARDYMNSKGIPYRDVDVEHSPQGAAEFRQRGGGGVPMIVINGAQMTGFNSAWVDSHIGS